MLREIAYSKAGIWKIQNKFGLSYCAKQTTKKSSTQKNGLCQKDTEASSEGLNLGQLEHQNK